MLIDFSLCTKLIEVTHGVQVKKIYHVGAHKGEEATIYSRNKISDVIWFEANVNLIDQLKKNIDRFDMRQSIVPCALWDSNSSIQFRVTNNGESSSLYELEKHSEYYPEIIVESTEQITAYRLDSLIDRSPKLLPWFDFDFLNIDTQGAELSILKGLGSYLNASSLKGIYLEINSEFLYKDIPLVEDIDSFLMSHGFFRVLTRWVPERGWGDGFYLKSRLL